MRNTDIRKQFIQAPVIVVSKGCDGRFTYFIPNGTRPGGRQSIGALTPHRTKAAAKGSDNSTAASKIDTEADHETHQ